MRLLADSLAAVMCCALPKNFGWPEKHASHREALSARQRMAGIMAEQLEGTTCASRHQWKEMLVVLLQGPKLTLGLGASRLSKKPKLEDEQLCPASCGMADNGPADTTGE